MQTWKRAIAGVGGLLALYGAITAYRYFTMEPVWLDLLHGYVLQEQQIAGAVILSNGLDLEESSPCLLKLRVAPVSYGAKQNAYDRPDFHLKCGAWVISYEDDDVNALNAERRIERHAIETSPGGESASVSFIFTDGTATVTVDTGERTVVFLDPAKSPAQRLEIALDGRVEHTDVPRDEGEQCGFTYFSFVRQGIGKMPAPVRCKGSLPRW